MRIHPVFSTTSLNDAEPGSLVLTKIGGRECWCLKCAGAQSGQAAVVPLGPQMPAGLQQPFLQFLPLQTRALSLGRNYVLELATQSDGISLELPGRLDNDIGVILVGNHAFLRLPAPSRREELTLVRVDTGAVEFVTPNAPRAFFRGWKFSIADPEQNERVPIAWFPAV